MTHTKTPITLPPIFPSGALKEIHLDQSYLSYEDSHPKVAPSSLQVVYCVPGIGDFRHSYRFLGPRLVEAGYRVIAQDMRGVGDSGTEFSSYNIEDIARDIITILDHEEITTPAILLTSSLSASSAVTVAADHPERVKAVITFGGFFRDMPGDVYFRPASYLLFNHLWGQPMWTSAFLSFFASPPEDIGSYVVAVKAKMLSDCNHASVIGKMIRSTKEHAWSKIGELRAPVMLVMGTRDPDFQKPEEETDYIASHLTGSRHVAKAMIDGAGHYPHVEKVEEVAKRVLGFLYSL
ncbi:hypothetical protein HDU67_003780 [Dinochytrium kinnereticum]|nr:hypothetical protein HDU67_003780 [Dinochytrium kinnereticum]